MTVNCPICKDSGKILLLTSYVDCDCKIKNLPIDVSVDGGKFLSLSGDRFDEIVGMVVGREMVSLGFKVLVQSEFGHQYRFFCNGPPAVGLRYKFSVFALAIKFERIRP